VLSRARLSPKFALRLGAGIAVVFLLLAVALGIGFHAGAGLAWARHAMLALGAASLLAGAVIAWFIARSFHRSSHNALKTAQRLDRVLQNVNARDS
jgi:uncharacterized membrane protein